MRSLALTTLVTVACLSWPAHGAKYKCIFLQDGSGVGDPCQIDSNDSNNNTCQRIYNRTLAGKCFASPQNEQLNCIFFNQTGQRPGCGRNFVRYNLRETNYSILCGEIKLLIAGLCSEGLPAIDFAHVMLPGSKQRQEQHGGGGSRRQWGLRLDPALDLLV